MKDKDHRSSLGNQEPDMMPNELMDMPGFVNELKQHTLLTGWRTNEPIAFAGALAMLSHLTGNTYQGAGDTSTNLYIAALSVSGMGKDDTRKTNKRLAAELGIIPSIQNYVASGPGLEDAVAASPSLLLQTDEADALLAATHGKNGKSNQLNKLLLEFFSDAETCHETRLTAKHEGKGRIISRPHLTLLATGVPEYFYSALSTRSLTDGLLGRCLFIDADGFYPSNLKKSHPFPESVLKAARMMVEREKNFRSTGVRDPIIVAEKPETKVALAELANHCDEETKRLMDEKLTTAAILYARLREKSTKLALLRAISEDPFAPCLKPEDILWGTKFALHITKRMLNMAELYVADGAFDHLKKRFIRLLIKHGGELDHSTLLKRLGVDATTFRKVARTLEACDEIDDGTISNGKYGYLVKGGE